MNVREIIELRKALHQNPELSGYELRTANRVRCFIEKHDKMARIENIGDTGLVAIYDYPNDGQSIMIRCELDALPIQEENQFSYKSKTEGISHKCGHDGHMAIVAGLTFWLKTQPFDSGKIILLFQPAEENGKGALQVINDKKFKTLKPDYIFALHNIPKYPCNSILVMNNGFSAEVQSFIIYVTGKESHAAEPENGTNPAMAIASIIEGVAGLNKPNQDDESFSILTPVHINMGQISYGISPACGELHYTARTWSQETMSTLKALIESIVKITCIKHELKYEVKWLEYFPASANDNNCNNIITTAAEENHFKIIERPFPFKFGEDFGWFSREHRTAMFGLGSGLDSPALHNADYDFPDEILETGIVMFKSIISNIMKEKEQRRLNLDR